MSAAADVRRRLRERAEHALRQAAMEDLRRQFPAATVAPYRDRTDLVWRALFVPLYRRVPWSTKVRVMEALRMTATRAGWSRPERTARQPWRPPVRSDGSAGDAAR